MGTPKKRARATVATATPRSSKRLRTAAAGGEAASPVKGASRPVKSEEESPPERATDQRKDSPAQSPLKRVGKTLTKTPTRSPAKAASKPAANGTQGASAPLPPRPSASPEPPPPKKQPTASKEATAKSAARGRKTKAPEMPLAARTAGHVLRLGAHVSAAGGVQNSVGNAVQIGANAFALFLKSQRKWANPPLAAEQAQHFVAGCREHGYDAMQHVVPHGSYLVNLAQPDAAKAAQAYDAFLDDLRRCDALGIALYNFHPGSTVGQARPAALQRIAARLNDAHRATASVVTLLENMAGAGNVIGGSWADLGGIVRHVADRARVGICLDTCHAFGAGYDLRTPAGLTAVLDAIDAEVGPGMLRALHVNDSKAPLGSHRDLHANIGTGCLGLRAFHALVNEPRLHGLPMVLETPIDRPDPNGGEAGSNTAPKNGAAKSSKDAAAAVAKAKKPAVKNKLVEDKSVWAREIKLLESLVGMDVDGPEFAALESALAAEGAAERARIQGQVDRSRDKAAKGGKKGRGKAQETDEDEDEDDDE